MMLKKILYATGGILLLLLLVTLTQVHLDIPVDQLKPEYAPPPSKFMNIDGMQVHYRDEGNGYPVVLIHGMSSSLHTWQAWTEVLSKQYRVIRMDLPGFGLTGPSAENNYTGPYYVSFIHKFLDSLGIKECYMAGSSLGGFITWQYTIAYPAQVRKIILEDAAGYPMKSPPPVFKLAQIKPLAMICRYVTPRLLVEQSVHQVYGDASKITDSIVDRYFKLSLRQGNREAFIAFVNGFKKRDTVAIHQIAVPTLIQWGEKDRWIPVDNAEKFHRDIAGSQLIIYPGVGHIPMEEDPGSSVQDALRFFAVNDSVEKVK